MRSAYPRTILLCSNPLWTPVVLQLYCSCALYYPVLASGTPRQQLAADKPLFYVFPCRADEEAAEDVGPLGSALGEQGAAKAATQLVIDLTERLHEAEAQVELLRGRLQTRRLSKVLSCAAQQTCQLSDGLSRPPGTLLRVSEKLSCCGQLKLQCLLRIA